MGVPLFTFNFGPVDPVDAFWPLAFANLVGCLLRRH